MTLLVRWSIAAFLVALMMPLLIFFGALGIILIPATLVLVPLLLVVGIRNKAKGPSQETEAADETPAAVPIVATAVETAGICPLGWSSRTGESWVLNGAWSGRELCPVAQELLTGAAGDVRSGEAADGDLQQCVGKEHLVSFELYKRRQERAGIDAVT